MPTIPPIDPTMATTGPEWSIAPAAPAPQSTTGAGFGDELAGALESLQATQTEAAEASQALATGQAGDPTEVIMAVEKARLSMELASQVRNKAVEAYTEIFRTQV